MERIVKVAPTHLEVAGQRQVKTAQRVFIAEYVVDSRNVSVTSEVVKI
jgi:hypothetical protein